MKRVWNWLQWIISRPLHRISIREILFMAGSAIVLFISLNLLVLTDEGYQVKVRASRLMQRGMDILRDEYLARGLQVDPDIDANLAGIIGLPSSGITTVTGSLRDKVLSTNTDMAALIVELLMKAGVKKGDTVAIGETGSFPALNLAAVVAVENLGATPAVISSVGASNWGATNPEFTWLDMEKILAERGIIHVRSVSVSLGGSDDKGMGMTPEGLQQAHQTIARNRIPLTTHSSTGGLEEAVMNRVQIYKSNVSGPVKAYINIGGGIVSLGLLEERQLPPGLTISTRADILNTRSVGLYFLSQKVPVINLDNIGRIAARYGIRGSAGRESGMRRAELYYKSNMLRFASGSALGIILILLYLVGTGRLDRWLHPKYWQS